MRDGHVVAGAVEPAGGAGVGQPGALEHRQRVHVGAYYRGRSGSVAQHADDTGAPDTLRRVEADPAQVARDNAGGTNLGERQLRMLVEVTVEIRQLREAARTRRI